MLLFVYSAKHAQWPELLCPQPRILVKGAMEFPSEQAAVLIFMIYIL